MHAPDPIRVVRIALRLSLAAAFLSAVADRFGWWAPFGQGSWGSMGAFADYTHQLVPFASGWLLTVIVWAATVTESTLGVLLLTDWWRCCRPTLSIIQRRSQRFANPVSRIRHGWTYRSSEARVDEGW